MTDYMVTDQVGFILVIRSSWPIFCNNCFTLVT